MAKKKANAASRWMMFVGIAVGIMLVWWSTPSNSALKQASTWQRMTEPGKLSAAHSHLENNCACLSHLRSGGGSHQLHRVSRE